MRLGEDGDIGTPGVRRWRELGGFREIADNAHERRKEKVCAEGVGAQDSDLGKKKQEFVDVYCDEVGRPSEEVISNGIDENVNELGDPSPEVRASIVSAIQERLE